MELRALSLGWIALVLSVAPAMAFQDPPTSRPVPAPESKPKVDEPAPLERWQKMSPEERAKLKERFDELRKMTEAEREALKARARELEAERHRLAEKLGPDLRERLRGMPPEERDRVLREHQLDERRRAGESLREGLDPEREDWVEHMLGRDRPLPIHDLRRELRGKLEDKMVERWSKAGSIEPEEREQLMALTPRERMGELLKIHRDRIVAAVKKGGLPEGVRPEKWQKMLKEERPERFLKQARKLGLERLAAPPGDPMGPGPGGGPNGKEDRRRPPVPPAVRELAELLRPTLEDRLDVAEKPWKERHQLLDGRIAKRLREQLAEADWLPELDRALLDGLDDGALIEELRDFVHSRFESRREPRGGRGPMRGPMRGPGGDNRQPPGPPGPPDGPRQAPKSSR